MIASLGVCKFEEFLIIQRFSLIRLAQLLYHLIVFTDLNHRALTAYTSSYN